MYPVLARDLVRGPAAEEVTVPTLPPDEAWDRLGLRFQLANPRRVRKFRGREESSSDFLSSPATEPRVLSTGQYSQLAVMNSCRLSSPLAATRRPASPMPSAPKRLSSPPSPPAPRNRDIKRIQTDSCGSSNSTLVSSPLSARRSVVRTFAGFLRSLSSPANAFAVRKPEQHFDSPCPQEKSPLRRVRSFFSGGKRAYITRKIHV